LIIGKSVKGIIYTKETSANNHCQIGNIPLVGKDILDWIEEKSGKIYITIIIFLLYYLFYYLLIMVELFIELFNEYKKY